MGEETYSQHDTWIGPSWVHTSQLTLHAIQQGFEFSYNYFVTGEDE
jgi:hypothetical protein